MGYCVGADFHRTSEGASAHHDRRTRCAACTEAQGRKGALDAALQAHDAGHDRVLLLWLDAVAVPLLDSAVLPTQLSSRPQKIRTLRIRRILRGLAGRATRRHP